MLDEPRIRGRTVDAHEMPRALDLMVLSIGKTAHKNVSCLAWTEHIPLTADHIDAARYASQDWIEGLIGQALHCTCGIDVTGAVANRHEALGRNGLDLAG